MELAGLCWFKENLRNIKYANGSEIPFAKPYYHELYSNTAQNEIDFGLLYTFESVAGGDVCPAGWRIPTIAEWELLKGYDANELKNPVYWLQPNDNSSGSEFDSRGAGIYNNATVRFEKLYGYTAYWSSNTTTYSCLCAGLNYYCNLFEIVEILKTNAISVRCIME